MLISSRCIFNYMSCCYLYLHDDVVFTYMSLTLFSVFNRTSCHYYLPVFFNRNIDCTRRFL